MKKILHLNIFLITILTLIGCVGRTPVHETPEEVYYKHDPAVFNADCDITWECTLKAAEELNWPIKSTDKASGSIHFATTYVYTPQFGEYKRVEKEPSNEEIKFSKVRSYLRRISWWEKITPDPAPPGPRFIREGLNLKVSCVSETQTEVKANYKIMPFYNYKIGYLGTVQSKGYFEDKLYSKIGDLIAEKTAPPPPPPPMRKPLDISQQLADIFFDFDKSEIRPDAVPVLLENAEVLKKYSDFTIVIQGYADIRGTDQYNLKLGQRRADATKTFFIGLGIDPVRIIALTSGETTRFAPGTTEEAYQLNRRSHFIPVNPGKSTGDLSRINKQSETPD